MAMIGIGTSFASGLQGLGRVQPIRKADAPRAQRDTSLPDDIVALSAAAVQERTADTGGTAAGEPRKAGTAQDAKAAPSDAEVRLDDPSAPTSAHQVLARARWQKALTAGHPMDDTHLVDAIAV